MNQTHLSSTALDAAVASLSATQHGVFSAAQTTSLGASESQRRRRVSSDRWHVVHPGVYRLSGSPATLESKLVAACLAGGPAARASHRSAAWLWDLPGGLADVIEVTCPRWHRTKYDDDEHIDLDHALIVHESRRFDSRDTALHMGVPLTTVEVTLLDLGAVIGASFVEQALDVAMRRELTTLPKVRATLQRLGRRGRDGTAALREVLDERAPVNGHTESPAETAMLRMLRRHALPTPVLQHVVVEGGIFLGRVDAAYPEHRIAIEYESYEHHTGKRALERDSARRNAFAVADWVYIAVTGADVRSGGSQVCSTIHAAIRASKLRLRPSNSVGI